MFVNLGGELIKGKIVFVTLAVIAMVLAISIVKNEERMEQKNKVSLEYQPGEKANPTFPKYALYPLAFLFFLSLLVIRQKKN